MVINHNMPANNALRLNGISQRKKNSALEKLSSGYMINRAADNAAGLAVSEKMRAHIMSLGAASKNIDDGINLINVADGVLQESESILQRMKQLAVQAANGTYSDEVDRTSIQLEIAQLTSEINEQANSAEFNGIPLFDGSIVGTYEWAYGIKHFPTVTPKDPSIITAGEAINDPFTIYYGENASLNRASSLNALNVPEPNFPLEGVFVIRVEDPEKGVVDAVLDFATENPDGDFDLDDFTAFFKDALKDVAEFEVTASGNIRVQGTGLGGNASRVHIGYPSAPSGSKYVYSSLFGDYKLSSVSNGGFETKEPLSSAEIEQLKLSGDIDSWTNSKGETLLDMLPDSTGFSFYLYEQRYNSAGVYVGSSLRGTVSTSKAEWPDDIHTFKELNEYLNAQSHPPYATGISVSLGSFGIERGNAGTDKATVYVSINRSVNPASAYDGISDPYYWNSSITPSYYDATKAPTSLQSDYPVKISDDIGVFTITVGNVAGVGTVGVEVDFATKTVKSTSTGTVLSFSAADENDASDMVDKINILLNENPPFPLPETIPPGYDPSHPVAFASVVGGRLSVKASERQSSVRFDERYSDRPMLSGTTTVANGYDRSSSISITDINGRSKSIRIDGGEYNDIDDFISKNADNFVPDYVLGKDETTGTLTITTVGEGIEYSMRGITSVPADLIEKLGFASSETVFTDGVTHETIPVPSSPLMLQVGSWRKDISLIAIPRLNAQDLGLMVTLSDILDSGSYHGISGSGVDGYVNFPNVEPGPVGYSLDMTSQLNANAAIDIIDNAINIISLERAQLGAKHNRLEITKASVESAAENLQAAESRIRDADLAKEMSEFTKQSIMSEISQTMIKQAGQLPGTFLDTLV